MLKSITYFIAFLLCLATPILARNSISIPVDKSFTIQPFFKVNGSGTGSKARYRALFFVKLINANGKLAVCGVNYGMTFSGPRADRFLKRSSVVLGKSRLVYNIRYFTDGFRVSKIRMAEFKSNPRQMVINASALAANFKYVLGLKARCKVSKINWAPQYANATPFIKIPEKIFIRKD